MILYTNPYSFNSRRCTAVVRQLGLEVTLHAVDLSQGEHHGAPFVAMNPNRKVPVLVDGELVLWESVAILQYLADQRPGQLLPETPAGRADVTRWQAWALSTLNPPTGVYLHENMVKPFFGLGDADPKALDAARPAAIAAYDVLERQLQGRDFLCGAAPTLADFTVYPTFEFAPMTKIPALDAHPALAAWTRRMAALPGFATSDLS